MDSSDQKQPDKVEKGLRFGCGFLFGIIPAFLFAYSLLGTFMPWDVYSKVIIGLVIFFTLACGILCVKMGDSFFDLFR